MSSVQPPSAASLRGAVDLSSLVNRPDPGAPGSTQAPGGDVPVPGLILTGTDDTFSAFLELSNSVPVVIMLGAASSEASSQLGPILEDIVVSKAGRFVLVTVDAVSNPQLAQAFQAETLPTVAAVVGGRPVGLFAGVHPADQVAEVIDQVLEMAVQQGITGTAKIDGADNVSGEPAEPVQAPLPPHHAEAFDAISRGDYPAAIAEYQTAMAQDPRDQLAVAGLAQASLLFRLQGKTQAEIRNEAAASPENLDAQMLVADLDLSGGHVQDAFDRLLELFPTLDQAGKDAVRARLIEHFEVVGTDDPRVPKTRSRLTALLY